ncbi:MAG: hypothetical protein NZ482_06405 [Gloeomargarita sp. SKYG98]|nr:hypothetical protein [Gloeomargarita sp. SKYG98]
MAKQLVVFALLSRLFIPWVAGQGADFTDPIHMPQPLMSPVRIQQSLTLRAWEEDPRWPPVGVRPDPNRPRSYAFLSLTFENTTLGPVDVLIHSVEIRSAHTGEVINSLPGSPLVLGPLEIAPQQYLLTSQQSYGAHRTLVGSLTYTVAGQTYTLTTSPVPVQDH